MRCEVVLRASVETKILILKLKSLCEKGGCIFEVRTIDAISENLYLREVKEDSCPCVVSLCHGMIHRCEPNSYSLHKHNEKKLIFIAR